MKAFTTVTLMAISAAVQAPTVRVAGDSTASRNVNVRGWGDKFAGYFDQESLHRESRARDTAAVPS